MEVRNGEATACAQVRAAAAVGGGSVRSTFHRERAVYVGACRVGLGP